MLLRSDPAIGFAIPRPRDSCCSSLELEILGLGFRVLSLRLLALESLEVGFKFNFRGGAANFGSVQAGLCFQTGFFPNPRPWSLHL